MQLQKYSGFINTDIYLNSAVDLGINYELLEDRLHYYVLSKDNKQLFMLNTMFSFNDCVAVRVVKDKYATSSLLRDLGIPVPDSKLFISSNYFQDASECEKILSAAEKMFPVVLKPLDLSFGKGVFTNLTEKSQLQTALAELKNMRLKQIMLESYIKGKDYRVLVVKGEVIDIIERIPAQVKGNGSLTISQLITQTNKQRQKLQLPKIEVDAAAREFISRSNLNLDSIPQKDQIIILKGVSNISAGGTTRRIDLDLVPQENIAVFEKIAAAMNLFLAGIDVISPDITQPLLDSKAAINEVNSNPHPDVHYFADMETSLEIPQKILSAYFD